MARSKTPVRLKNAMKTLFSLWHVLASSLLSWQEVATRRPRADEMAYSRSMIKSCTSITSRLRGVPSSPLLSELGNYRVPELNSN